MKCPECSRRMDQVITCGHQGNNQSTDYVCMHCELRYTFHDDCTVQLRKFKVNDLREKDGNK